MELNDLIQRAMNIRRQYAELEQKKYGQSWTKEDIALGLVVDIGDLIKLIMAHKGIREANDIEQRLAHELSDCLWSIIVLSQIYNIDLEQAFFQTMNEIEQSIISEHCD